MDSAICLVRKIRGQILRYKNKSTGAIKPFLLIESIKNKRHKMFKRETSVC